MASLEKRSVSNLVEIMADERWERLVEQQGVAYAQTIAGAMTLNSTRTIPQTARNCAEQFSISSPEKNAKAKNDLVEIRSLTFWQAFCSVILSPRYFPGLVPPRGHLER